MGTTGEPPIRRSILQLDTDFFSNTFAIHVGTIYITVSTRTAFSCDDLIPKPHKRVMHQTTTDYVNRPSWLLLLECHKLPKPFPILVSVSCREARYKINSTSLLPPLLLPHSLLPHCTYTSKYLISRKMVCKSSILPLYEKSIGMSKELTPCLDTPFLSDPVSDPTSIPHTVPDNRRRSSWQFWRIRIISPVNFLLQLIVIAIGLCFLPKHFLESTNHLVIFWVALVKQSFVTGVMGLISHTFMGYVDDRYKPTPEVIEDRHFHNAIYSFAPWVWAFMSLYAAYAFKI